MLHASLQTNSYQSQSNLNNAVSKAVTGAKPDFITKEQKSERATISKEPSDRFHMTLSMESVNQAIDDKVAEYFTQYPNGGSDQEFKQFMDSVKLTGI
jgi:hypothetical protein